MIDFESLFAALPSPYMVVDAGLNYVAANRAYEGVVRRPASELVGRNLFELFPNEGPEGRRLRDSLRRVLQTGESDTIAFIPYEIPRPEAEGGGVEARYWTAVHTPLRDADGRVAFVLQNTVDVTDLVPKRAADGVAARAADAPPGGLAILQRAREAESAYRRTLAESDEFRRLFAQAPGMIAILEGPEHRFAFANESYRGFTGHRPLIGRTVGEVFPEIVGQGFVAWLDAVFQTGRVERGEGVRVLLQDEAGESPREAYIDFNYQPIRDGRGAIAGVFVQGTDRTDQYRTLHRQQLLLDELNHRVKNTLSTVQSIARRSFRGVDEAGRAAFEARIKALSNVHDIISDRHWEGIRLDSLLRHELAAFGASRVTADGPAVELTPRAAIALAMVFHELASNAIKYGPLADERGALTVAWRLVEPDEDRQIVFEWREIGNRSAPAGWPRGLGMRTLDRILEGELGGRLALDLDGDGFICRFQTALAEVGKLAG